jgi:two-component system sensor histidine kinase BarA
MGILFKLGLSLALLLFSVCANAQPTLHIYENTNSLSLSDNVAQYIETNGEETINQVIQRQNDFVYFWGGGSNLGFHSEGVWFSNRINNVSSIEDWVVTLNYSQLDKVDFYLVQNQQVVAQSHQGKMQTEQRFRIPTVKIHLPLAQEFELFVRVENRSSSLIAPLTLMTENQHITLSQIDSLLWGIFYGGLIILAIYNLVLYLDVRSPSILGYAGYIISVISWQFVWGGHVNLLTENQIAPWLIRHSELFFLLIGIMSGIFSLLFLNTRINARVSQKLIIFFLFTLTTIGICSLFNLLPAAWELNIIYGVGLAAICCYIFAGFEAYFNHFKPARYFLIAWSILGLGAAVSLFRLLGIMSLSPYTAYAFQTALFVQACLFAFALMEKSRSQLEEEVQQATNELRHNMELIEEQNARLDIARKDAIKASNVKSQFLANMSHEIRTPLNAILGFSKELNQLSLPSEKQDQIRIINGAADNLLTIVNDVLDFSKIEAGKLQINNQPFSPNQLFEEMVTLMSKSAHMKGLEFVFELTPLPEKLIGDVFRIKQILNNLLSNALKFTSSGYIKLGVKGRSLPHGIHELQIQIADTGIGISRKDRKKLFNAFSQIDDALSRNYQGTGLGLVICQELVRLMRGNLNLKSTPGQGSVFTITLRNNQLSQRFSLTPTTDWIGKQVVLFDPNPDTRRSASSLLLHLGAHITSVESLDYLNTIDFEPDYLFCVVPGNHLSHRQEWLTTLVKFPAKRRVLWYSGPDPINQSPHLNQYFYSQIRMPVTPGKLAGLQHQKEYNLANPMQAQLNSLPRARILAVDDMDMNLKLLEAWLVKSPVTLTLSNSGQDAVNRCQRQEFDLILMDVQMAGMDGLQASRHIRKTALNMGTPIIAVTAHAFKEEQERLLESGMDDYLPKPIEQSVLLELIRRWCTEAENTSLALPSLALPTLDWQLAMKRTNHVQSITRDLLQDFVKILPQTIEIIKLEWEARNYNALKAEVHRLHGACCYTGVPKLQALVEEVEIALKLDRQLDVAEHLPSLILEAEIVCAQGNKLLSEQK